MANEIYSKEVSLEIDMGYPANPDWKLVICTISKSFNKAVASVTLNNDCSPDFVRELPTDGSWNMSIEGNISKEPTADEVSASELQVIQDSKAVKPWRLRSLDDEYYREGFAWINQLDETGSAGEYLTFSLGLTGTEPPVYEEPVIFNTIFNPSPATFAAAGETIEMDVVITNLSKRNLTGIFVGVAKASFSQSTTDLIAGASTVVAVDYTTTAADVTAGSITATAVVSLNGQYVVSKTATINYVP